MKLPPMRKDTGLFRMEDVDCQRYAAGGLLGDIWIASSMYGFEVCRVVEGGEVMVKPPTFGMLGT